MFKLLFCFLPLLSINSCVENKASNHISLIVYSEFVNPQKTYDSLIEEVNQSKLVDSLKIIGRPITVSELDVQIDTSLVIRYKISFDSIDYKIKNLKPTNHILEQYIANESGQEIPFSAFSKVVVSSKFYKPELFLPEPNVYHYNEKEAVKVDFYCIQKNENKLIELLKNYTSDNSNEFINENWEIEIIK